MDLTKEQLQAQLKKIEQQESKFFINEHYPSFKCLEGTYWKTRNGYGGDTKKWWYYTKIKSIKKSNLYKSGDKILSTYEGYSFQTCSYGIFTVETEKRSFVHSLGQQITEKEFNAAWNKQIEKLTKL